MKKWPFVVIATCLLLQEATTGFIAKQTSQLSSVERVSRVTSFVPTLPRSSAGLNVFRRLLAVPLEETIVVNEFPPSRLVVLLPAFNECKRIGETLDTYRSFLNVSDSWKQKSCILVVDDGSDDGTADLVGNFTQDEQVPVDCISLSQNQGKGAAVSFGIHHLVQLYGNESCLVLIADADGSGDISCLNNMTNALGTLIASSSTLQSLNESSFWNTPAIINGYRGYNGSSLSRSILRWGFRTTVRILCGDLRVRDSQCGFKLMTLAAARQLYLDLNLKRWSHDVEVLYRARECNVPIDEQTVPWQDKEGSKLVESSLGTVQVSAIMFMEVMRMRLEYALGRWKLPMNGSGSYQ